MISVVMRAMPERVMEINVARSKKPMKFAKGVLGHRPRKYQPWRASMTWSIPQTPDATRRIATKMTIALGNPERSRPKSFKLVPSPRERVDCECEYSSNTGPLDDVEAGDEGLGLDAVDDETPGEIGGEEDAEARAFLP